MAPQALLKVTHQDHSTGITLLLLFRASGVQRGGKRGAGHGHPKSEITKIEML